MSNTYGYSLCRHCGGSGKTDQQECPACQGAGLTATRLTAQAANAVVAPDPSISQPRTTDFALPRY